MQLKNLTAPQAYPLESKFSHSSFECEISNMYQMQHAITKPSVAIHELVFANGTFILTYTFLQKRQILKEIHKFLVHLLISRSMIIK